MNALLELPTAKTNDARSRRRKRREAGRRRRERPRRVVVWPAARPQVRRGGRRRSRDPRRPLAHALPDHHDAERSRHHRQREHPAQRDAELEQQERRQRPDDGAGGVHRAVQTERQTPVLVAHVGREQGVARRRAHALADAVEDAPAQGDRPNEGQRQDEFAQRRQPVASEHERAPPPGLVGEPAKRIPGEARGRFGRAFDQAENRRRGAQHLGHEAREHRIDHLRAEVGDEADHAQGDDVAGQRGQPAAH
jgi:hypothetical protein